VRGRPIMDPEFLEHERLSEFELELRRDEPDGHIDYTRVLSRVFDKITGAEIEGPLALLKADEIASGAMLQNVENGVLRRISEYLEFDEPIDEFVGLWAEVARAMGAGQGGRVEQYAARTYSHHRVDL